MSSLIFRNTETDKVYPSEEIDEMPTGHYQCISNNLWHTELLVMSDRNVLVTGFNHTISSEVIEDEFDGAFVGVEYYEVERSATDWLRKNFEKEFNG